MRFFSLLLFVGFLMTGCSTIDESQLIGHWKNSSWEFVFEKEGRCSLGRTGGMKSNLKYSLLGNSMEISENGKVIVSGLTVKSVTADSLIIQFRNLVGSGDQMDNDQILLRQ